MQFALVGIAFPVADLQHIATPDLRAEFRTDQGVVGIVVGGGDQR